MRGDDRRIWHTTQPSKGFVVLARDFESRISAKNRVAALVDKEEQHQHADEQRTGDDQQAMQVFTDHRHFIIA